MSGPVAADRRAIVAVDLGAESCRVSLLRATGDGLCAQLVHRFANGAREVSGGLRWPLRTIEEGVMEGLRRCGELAPEGIRSIGIDGWAVDYVRLDEHGAAVEEPFCYRDKRTVEAERWVHERVEPAVLRAATGVQLQRINTAYQLVADRLEGRKAAKWLNLPEYLLYRLGAPPVAEWTNASHTQLTKPGGAEWDDALFEALELDRGAAAELVAPGTVLGKLRGVLTEVPAYRDTWLIAPACHDTASAVTGIAVPADGCDWAYISIGTWSLVGSLVRKPVMSERAAESNFTNLAAPGGQVLFHRGVTGMWLLRQCVAAWEEERGAAVELPALVDAAAELEDPDVLLRVDEPELMLPGGMPGKIAAQIAGSGGGSISTGWDGAPRVMNVILHSLAATYAEVLREAQAITGCGYRNICTIGGGSRNRLLHALLEKATGMTVCRGHGESSSVGNFAVQLAALESGVVDAGALAGWARSLADSCGSMEVG